MSRTIQHTIPPSSRIASADGEREKKASREQVKIAVENMRRALSVRCGRPVTDEELSTYARTLAVLDEAIITTHARQNRA